MKENRAEAQAREADQQVPLYTANFNKLDPPKFTMVRFRLVHECYDSGK